ncbi:MAG: hypothetical protein K2L15_04695 [Eubacteriales bacterium]|nr:hypothetical protein [Eubacteriales bacterium]
MEKTKETDLFEPIKKYFIKKNYKVQGEVKNCDIVCLKDEEMLIIELKKSFNLKVLYQAMERKAFSNYVYIGIERPKNFRKKEVKNMLKVLEKMEIGLITVALDSPTKNVDIVLEPCYKKVYKTSKKRKIILNEINNRRLETNLGGSSTKNSNILTAYREKAIYIACVLEILEKASGKEIKEIIKIENPNAILRGNHFGYFEKVERGIYALSETGINMLFGEDFKDAIEYYKKEVDKLCLK